MKKKVIVIGSGFSGISAAAYLGKAGYEVCVLEKNATFGGRARTFRENDFLFDMGPSWYWMPDVFANFFKDFGKKVEDYYELKKLEPAFDLVFKNQEIISIPNSYGELRLLFEKIEPGSAVKLDAFMQSAKLKYEIGMEDFVFKPGLSITEFLNFKTLKGATQLSIFRNFRSYVKKHFKDKRLQALMEFPVLFLGAMPQKTPALYSLMNYAGLKLGTFYPMGGFGKIIDGMISVAKENGVTFNSDSAVEKIIIDNKKVSELHLKNKTLTADCIIASADYHHVESLIVPPTKKNYSEEYWNTKTFAPSCLLFYLGVNEKVKNLNHHTLFFDEDLDNHSNAIYTNPEWPENPLFYVCCPSKTDPAVAPEGKENLFILMPLAPGIEDNETLREKYFNLLLARLEKYCDQKISDKIIYKKSYCINDFISDYNAYKGNAYGLANTLKQTAILKPKIKSKHADNLFFAGQLTVPGPGVPPSIISGQLAATLAIKHIKKQMS